MSRTPLARLLRDQLNLHRIAEATGRSLTEIRDQVAERADRDRTAASGTGRRKFIGGAAAAAAGTALWSVTGQARVSQPRIAILGGGLAGLSAALGLSDAGYASTIYEANPVNIGGRCQSDFGSAQGPYTTAPCSTCHDSRPGGGAGYWSESQITDMFGEMIDTSHTTMLSLANRFGFHLVDLLAAEPTGSSETYHFNGSYYPKARADADFAALYSTLRADLHAAGYPTTYASSRPGGAALDAMSIHDWIETRVPGGHSNPLGKVLDAAYCIEFGADTTDQASLNLIYLLGYGRRTPLSVFGPSDERYRVQGGIGQIPLAMAEELHWQSRARLGWWLESISMASDGTYRLDFDVDGQGSRTEAADIVVMTLPFAVLRNLDYARAGFDSLKDRAIQNLGRGKNGKLQLQFDERYWNRSGPWGLSNGTSYSDTGYQNTWESSRGLGGTSGILLKYTGGTPVDSLAQTHPYGNSTSSRTRTDAETFLGQLEPVFPGISPHWNGKVAGSMAHRDPRFGCSYSYWRVGQYTDFAGYESVRQGNVFFAGEHTCYDFQGWMEGAARSGTTAAEGIVRSLRGGGR